MFKFIKKFLNAICWLFTALINLGQRIVCNIESRKLYKLPFPQPKLTSDKYYIRYKKHLKKYGLSCSRRSFRVFSRYLAEEGNDPADIVPQVIVNNYIVPVLNPVPLREYFEDKNMFDKIFPHGFFPPTIMRRIGKRWYDGEYNLLKGFESELIKNKETLKNGVIFKASRHSSSGRGIEIYKYKEDRWTGEISGGVLSEAEIYKNWGNDDIIVQHVVTQLPWLAQFNPSSVNTLRVNIYNSIADGKPHLLWAILRIGGKGSVVDNAHAGGIYIGVDKNGTLEKHGLDQYGNKYTVFNNIDFSKEQFIIPEFDKIQQFAFKCANYLFPNRLLALDITIGPDGEPQLIEYNLRGYSTWFAQFTGRGAFGDFNDEILEYVTSHKSLSQKVFYSID